jgi:hypothetical protein
MSGTDVATYTRDRPGLSAFVLESSTTPIPPMRVGWTASGVISVVFGEVEPGLGEPPVNIRRRLSTTPPRTCVCGTRLGPIPLRHLTTQIFRVFEAPAVAATYAPKWAFPKTQTFLRNGIKRPISAASVRPGKSHVFRHALQCTRLPYVLAESGLRRGERVRRRESDGRNRTFFGTRFSFS